MFFLCKKCGLISIIGKPDEDLCMPCYLNKEGTLYKKGGRPRKKRSQRRINDEFSV